MLEEIYKKYEMVIGLEVHAQLKTHSKLMSPAKNEFGSEPNSAVGMPCIGMPGALPSLNKAAIEMALKAALALHCKIQETSIFSRKHYFYPDLPKGYQISQYDRPYAENGKVEFHFEDQVKVVGLTRIHMEEDAGKNLHFDERQISLVDLNRSSVPLIEIVSEPEIRSPEEAGAYLKALRRVLRYLEVCDGNMEEGSFRCDANISLRPHGQEKFGTRVELKNINSFKNLEKALIYEAHRQYDELESGKSIHQETRLWDANQNKSLSMRSKEEASDYRYMPEPDLLPLKISADFKNAIKEKLPELPMTRMKRFEKEYHRSTYDAEVLTASKDLADYFEKVAIEIQDFALASNFIQTNVLAVIQDIETEIPSFYPDATALSGLLKKVIDKSLSLGMAKEVFEVMRTERRASEAIIEERGLAQVNDDSQLMQIIHQVMKTNPNQLEQFRSGKDKLFGFFMGQCQKELKGKGNPVRLKELLEIELKK